MLPVGLNKPVNVAWSETFPPTVTPADGVVVIDGVSLSVVADTVLEVALIQFDNVL